MNLVSQVDDIDIKLCLEKYHTFTDVIFGHTSVRELSDIGFRTPPGRIRRFRPIHGVLMGLSPVKRNMS